MRAVFTTTAALTLLFAHLATAQTYQSCYEPDPPSCIDRFGTFDDEWSFDRCRRDMEDYVDEMVSFRSCLANWHEAAGNEVEDVIERFNCKASGDSFCR